ncbi:MAG: cytochrome c biogenesis protein CcsA [Bacteroidota bacterium]
MQKIINILFSTRLTGILFIFFAAAMGIATFIENDYGTQTSKALVYNAWWFELIMLLFMINFIGNIKRYNLLKKEKSSILLFHLAFVLIILGAGITRYISFEGMMPIREGETTDLMLSNEAYLNVHIDDGEEQKSPVFKDYLFANIPQKSSGFTAAASKFLNLLRGGNDFEINTDFKGKPVEINYVNYIANAEERFVENSNGPSFLKIVEASSGSRHDHLIKKGDAIDMHNVLVAYENITEGAINIFTLDNKLMIKAPFNGNHMIMDTRELVEVKADSIQDFHLGSLYSFGNFRFVIPETAKTGVMQTVSGDKNTHPDDLLEIEVKTKNESKKVKLYGRALSTQVPTSLSLDGLNFRITYGSNQVKVPFSVKLRDFQLERYPGSMSPKSYASEITVIDKDKSFDFRIFMNNILDYRGYRFFQSSYDDTGEVETTYLSVNHDMLGTWTTYIGYGFLFLGMIWAMFSKKTRFGLLRKRLDKIKKKKAELAVLLLLVSFSVNAQLSHDLQHSIDSIIQSGKIDEKHAKDFGSLIIQDEGGRMKPLNTFASELLRKVSKKDHYGDLNANQVVVSMVTNPRTWYFIPFIYIKKDNTKVRDLISIPHDQKYARFSDLFTEEGVYKLKGEVAKAHKKKIKTKYEESILNIDGRANLLFGALQGGIFKFFPLDGDKNNKWFSNIEVPHAGFKGADSLYVVNIIPLYTQALQKASLENDYSGADKFLESIHQYQQKFGSAVMPSEKKVELEIFYNKYDIFKGLFWKYMLAGSVLFILVILQIFKDAKWLKKLININTLIIILLFIYHTVGLGVRWYISGHAPWSNGYESMIYVSWATMLFGLILGRKSSLTLAATTFVTSMLLMIAHWNWMDPSIGNLVPVLDSYWLMVHVAIIVASYGPFTISMILGLIAMILYIFTTQTNKNKLKLAIDEITVINEMSLTIGLILLTIGNFLGGMWANESWGRYWGWDPKETWALISIMVYAFVLHMRLIPGLKGKYAFNMISVFAFTSILMTYLGVNHLLSGLHSYASGETAAIPDQIWGWLIISIILSVLAYFNYKKFYKSIKK